jgi:DNA-binding MarR family transcriptional regulator
VKAAYLEIITLVERLHRQCLEIIKAELERRGIRDLNNVQALILYNIGEEELSVGELTQRGYYLGSNVSYNVKKMVENGYVSYNVKKMVENGYLIQERSPHDRRSFHVRASDKGVEIFRGISQLFDQHAEQLGDQQITEDNLGEANKALRRLQQFWSNPSAFGGRITSAA